MTWQAQFYFLHTIVDFLHYISGKEIGEIIIINYNRVLIKTLKPNTCISNFSILHADAGPGFFSSVERWRWGRGGGNCYFVSLGVGGGGGSNTNFGNKT